MSVKNKHFCSFQRQHCVPFNGRKAWVDAEPAAEWTYLWCHGVVVVPTMAISPLSTGPRKPVWKEAEKRHSNVICDSMLFCHWVFRSGNCWVLPLTLSWVHEVPSLLSAWPGRRLFCRSPGRAMSHEAHPLSLTVLPCTVYLYTYIHTKVVYI